MVTIYVLPETKENYPTSKAFHGKIANISLRICFGWYDPVVIFNFSHLVARYGTWHCLFLSLQTDLWAKSLNASLLWKIFPLACFFGFSYLAAHQIFRPSNRYEFVFRFPFDRQGCWFSHFLRSVTTSPKSRPMAAELWPLGELWRNPPCSPGQLGERGPEIKNIPCEYRGLL